MIMISLSLLSIGNKISLHSFNCEDHSAHTKHDTNSYIHFAKSIQSAIIMRFPFIKVYLKAIETDIILHQAEEESDKKKKTLIIDDLYKEVRIGAMEVYLGMNINNVKTQNLIFSKLTSHYWPNIENLLDIIVQYLPKFNLLINIFDYESPSIDVNKEFEDQKPEDLTYSRFEDVEIVLYYLKQDDIKAMNQTAFESNSK